MSRDGHVGLQSISYAELIVGRIVGMRWSAQHTLHTAGGDCRSTLVAGCGREQRPSARRRQVPAPVTIARIPAVTAHLAAQHLGRTAVAGGDHHVWAAHAEGLRVLLRCGSGRCVCPDGRAHTAVETPACKCGVQAESRQLGTRPRSATATGLSLLRSRL